jgi:hypothetical protein
MKNSITSITNYAVANFSIKHPGTCDKYNIYERDGKLLHTMGSHEFRGEEVFVCSIALYNEYAPYSRKDIRTAIEEAVSQLAY